MASPSFHMFEHRVGGLAWRDGPVIDDRRGDAAGADAACRQQRDLPVRSGFTRLNPRLLLNRGEQLVRPTDIASRAHAYDAGVRAFRLECAEMVKGGDAIDAAG